MTISFSEEENEHVTCTHEDDLMITAELDEYDVKKVLIDSSSSTYVIFLDALKEMDKSEKDLKKVNFPLMGFVSNGNFPQPTSDAQLMYLQCVAMC